METSERLTILLLILVENYPINHHIVACSDIVNSDGDTHFNSRAYHIPIEDLAAPRHISDGFPETVSPRPAAFLQHDCTARSVIGRGHPSGCQKQGCLWPSRCATTYLSDPAFQFTNRHEVHDPVGRKLCLESSSQTQLNKFKLPRMMSVSAK